MSKNTAVFVAALFVLAAATAGAQDSTGSGGGHVDANNPLATFTTVAVQNYFVPKLTGATDTTANTLWVRYAKPVGNWIVRASLPVANVPLSATVSESGVGDLNVFAARLIDVGEPGVAFGVGPQVTFDSATERATGAGKTQAGLAAVYFNGSSQRFQWGGLATWQKDIAGSGSRLDTELLVLQPFYFVQLGNGLYFRGTPAWVFNREADTYHVPVGAGIGKVLPYDDVVFNVYIEPQYTVLSKGPGQPKLQILAGFNMQFR